MRFAVWFMYACEFPASTNQIYIPFGRLLLFAVGVLHKKDERQYDVVKFCINISHSD